MGKKKQPTPQPGKPFSFSRRKGFMVPRDLAACGRVYWDAATALRPGISSGSLESHPLIFLYRHSIEAYLKSILLTVGGKIGISEREVRDSGHDLCAQTTDVLRVSQEFDMELTRRTQTVIFQFQGVDPGSDTFRYDLIGNRGDINLEHFTQECDRAIEELRSLYARIYEDLSSEATRQVMEEEGLATEDSN